MERDFDLLGYFKNPPSQRQKQYDAVRAIVLEKQSVEMIAKKYNYKHSTIYALLRDAKAGKIELFPVVQKGPQQKRTSSDVQEKIIAYRKQRLSTPNIQSFLAQENIHLSVSTVERILKHAGFGKLKRRTNKACQPLFYGEKTCLIFHLIYKWVFSKSCG